jgi:hypothetical protein
MNTTIMEQSPDCLKAHQATSCLEKELQELEDTYAECLCDNVDAKTLTMLWLRIKAIKRQLALV